MGVVLLVFIINTKENWSLCVHNFFVLVTLNCILKIATGSFGIAPGLCQISVNQAHNFEMQIVPESRLESIVASFVKHQQSFCF